MGSATEQRAGRRERRAQTRSAVIRAAVELAEAGSFKDLTVDEIARAAGVSRPAFYLYFRDKGELLLAAVEEVAGAFYEEADRWWHGEGEPQELVHEAVAGVVGVYAGNASLMRVATEVSTYDDDVRGFWIALVDRFIVATADHIRTEAEAGDLAAATDPRATAEGLVWMTERCCYIYLGRGERDPAEVTASLLPVWTAALYG